MSAEGYARVHTPVNLAKAKLDPGGRAALDKEKVKAMERAELRCRQLKMGMVPYFQGLSMKATSVVFWKAIKRQEN